MSNLIEIEHLQKHYGKGKNQLSVLEDINLSIKEGENIALVGPSGCGKSTFIQLLGLLDKASSGQIKFQNKNYTSAGDKERTLFRRKNIGFIYQFHHLLPEFSALENVILPLLINNFSQEQAKKEAKKLLSSLGLEKRLDHKPAELSGGEQQRVAIARGIIHQPQILLADEPTGNLDPQNAALVFDLFLEQIKQRKQTAIIVTHNIDLAKKLDKIITIKNGKLAKF